MCFLTVYRLLTTYSHHIDEDRQWHVSPGYMATDNNRNLKYVPKIKHTHIFMRLERKKYVYANFGLCGTKANISQMDFCFFFGLRKNEKCLFNGFLLQYLWIFWTQKYKVNNYVFIKRWMNNIKTCRHVYIMCAGRNDSWLDNRFFCLSLLRCENGICDEIIF